jgi:GH24 family phage-related lysozyme (muramidase)
MHQSVIEVWHQFSEPLEGRVLHMYLDVKGLITVGVGNLIDPVGAALGLPWKLPDGSRATIAQVRADWLALKGRQDLAKRHYKYAAPITTVRLTDADVDALVERRLRGNEVELRKHFWAWDGFPADAQLGIMSMAWACGAGFPLKFKAFTAAANAGMWDEAAARCKIRENWTTPDGKLHWNHGVVPRNKHNRTCFLNAAHAVKVGLPADVLRWPDTADTDPPPAPSSVVPDRGHSAKSPIADIPPPADHGAAALALSTAATSAVDAVRESALDEIHEADDDV